MTSYSFSLGYYSARSDGRRRIRRRGREAGRSYYISSLSPSSSSSGSEYASRDIRRRVRWGGREKDRGRHSSRQRRRSSRRLSPSRSYASSSTLSNQSRCQPRWRRSRSDDCKNSSTPKNIKIKQHAEEEEEGNINVETGQETGGNWNEHGEIESVGVAADAPTPWMREKTKRSA